MTQIRHALDLSIVIPAYNERTRIGPTVTAYDDWLSARGARYEILIVDDGSSDDTVAFVAELARSRPAVRVIACSHNRGKGAVVRRGMLTARGAVRVMTDADGSVQPDQLPRIVEPVAAGRAGIAVGSRYAPGANVTRRQPWYRVAWSRLGNALVRRLVVPDVLDTQCGFKALSAGAAVAVFERARVDGWAFDLEVLGLAHRAGFVIAEVPVVWADDPRSKISPVRDALANLRELFSIRWRLGPLPPRSRAFAQLHRARSGQQSP